MAEENKKNKIDINKKDGIAYLKELGLKEVSDKTFINQDNLATLLEKDFENINKTKALGFIQILQREFNVDLSELKKEYLQFNHSHKKEQVAIEQEDVVERIAPPLSLHEEEKPKKILMYILMGVATLLGAYYLFSTKSEIPPVVPMDLNVVKNEVVTKEAKESLLALDEAYEKEVNESDDMDLNKVVEEMFKNSDINESDIDTENNQTDDTNKSNAVIEEKNESVMQSALNTPAKEEEVSLADIEEEPVPKIIPVIETKKSVWKERQESKKKTLPKKVENSQQEGLYIEPIQKAWVGVIYLDTMKKKDYLIRNRLKLDASKDQIILVGHKNFKIFNHKLEQGFKSKKMVRFLYRDGELTELSKREYLDYLGSTRW
jgi:hypothetical protein